MKVSMATKISKEENSKTKTKEENINEDEEKA